MSWDGVRTALFATAMLSAALCASCDRGAGAKAHATLERPPAPVTATAALQRDVPVYLDEIGRTIAVDTVSVVPQVGGLVTAVHFEDGALVKKGQLLFEIDARPFEATLAAAQATLAQNRAEATWAEADFKRTEELLPANVVSQLEFDQKKSAWGVAQAKIEAANAAVQSARLDLEYTKIYSPLDGRAGARLVDPGNVVKENDKPLLVIQRLNPIYAEFTITENDLGTVRKFMAQRGINRGDSPEKGLKVQIDLPGDSQKVLSALAEIRPTTRPATNSTGPREGELTFLDNAVQSGTGTVRLRATVPNPDRYFWPGQFVNVRLILATKKNAVLIPADSQQIGQQGPYVYVVSAQQTAELRPIKPGQRQGDLLVVEEGVQPGDKVIVTGQMTVMPGGKVVVTNEAQSPPQSAQAGG
ncbi:MAG: efflux RND transporter periplasmic adaptor subunit [Tepidisphaeraceae bacterium]